MKATKKLLTVVPISSATQPQPVYTHSQLMGRGNETLLKVPISEEVERTKLSIKQKAAELTKKTRGSFRRKNGVSGGGGCGADDRAGRNLKLPRERRATQRQRSATKNRRKFQDAIDIIDTNDDHDDDDDDDDGNMVSCRIIE